MISEYKYKIAINQALCTCDLLVVKSQEEDQIFFSASGFARIGFRKTKVLAQSRYVVIDGNEVLLENNFDLDGLKLKQSWVRPEKGEGALQKGEVFKEINQSLDLIDILNFTIKILNSFKNSANELKKNYMLPLNNQIYRLLISREKNRIEIKRNENKWLQIMVDKKYLYLMVKKIRLKIDFSQI